MDFFLYWLRLEAIRPQKLGIVILNLLHAGLEKDSVA